MKCHDHGRKPCAVPRCLVLALCAAEIRQAIARGAPVWSSYGMTLGYPVEAMAEAAADRLVAWMRWRGERRAGALSQQRPIDPWATHGEGQEQHDWVMFGPGFYHPLDKLLPYNERIRALSGTCPAAKCTGYHDNPTWKPGRWEPPLLPCDHDGIDWATVLVFLDWLADRGWTLQDVHEWRPPRKDDL